MNQLAVTLALVSSAPSLPCLQRLTGPDYLIIAAVETAVTLLELIMSAASYAVSPQTTFKVF